MKTILIIEPNISGHHIRYLEWVVQAGVEQGCRIVIGTAFESADNKRFLALLGAHAGVVNAIYLSVPIGIFEARGVAGLILREFRMAIWMRRIARLAASSYEIDEIFIPYVDYCLYGLALFYRAFGKTPWSAIAMRPVFHFVKMGLNGPPESIVLRAKEKLFFKLLNSHGLKKIFTIDPCLYEYVIEKCKSIASIKHLPDPVEMKPIASMHEARKTLGLPDVATVILIYGAIDFRKGIVELVEYVAANNNESVVALIAGVQTSETRSFLKEPTADSLRKKGRLIELDRFVSDDEEALLFGACDIVWLRYKGHYGMSGVLLQAVLANKAVIACDEGLIGWYRKKAAGPLGFKNGNGRLANQIDYFPGNMFSENTLPNFKKIIFGG